jgi:hypothetical protein
VGDAGGMRRDEHVAAAVDVDDPDLVAANVGQPAPVGRPLRIRDVLLRGRDDVRRPAAQGGNDDLAGAGELGRVRDRPVARVDADLPRRVDGDQPLDGQAACRRRDRRPEARPPGPSARVICSPRSRAASPVDRQAPDGGPGQCRLATHGRPSRGGRGCGRGGTRMPS